MNTPALTPEQSRVLAKGPFPDYPWTPKTFVHPNGLSQSYLDEGEGDPVVMLHGNPSWSYYWRHLVRGLQDVNPQSLELMRVLSASQREIFFKIRVQNSLPYLFSALKIAASTSVIGAIVGEWIGSTKGIGALIIQATYAFDTPLLYATIVVGSTFSACFFGVIGLIERRIVKWKPDRVS